MSPRQPTPETDEPDDRGIIYDGDEWDEVTTKGERSVVTNTDDDVVDEEDDVEGHHDDDEQQAPDDDVK